MLFCAPNSSISRASRVNWFLPGFATHLKNSQQGPNFGGIPRVAHKSRMTAFSESRRLNRTNRFGAYCLLRQKAVEEGSLAAAKDRSYRSDCGVLRGGRWCRMTADIEAELPTNHRNLNRAGPDTKKCYISEVLEVNVGPYCGPAAKLRN
ncbi:hypothetical protein K438DRAFT_1749590 [Mycena galopus ATCC 62051]|nr:hypothetical protein K438DRAFT_1749590 [Mycena galopus ATCC 62051]